MSNSIQLTSDQKKVLAAAHFKHMLSGICWVVGGVLLTALTMSIGNGSGFVFYGAVIFGVIDFFRGLFGWLKYSV